MASTGLRTGSSQVRSPFQTRAKYAPSGMPRATVMAMVTRISPQPRTSISVGPSRRDQEIAQGPSWRLELVRAQQRRDHVAGDDHHGGRVDEFDDHRHTFRRATA